MCMVLDASKLGDFLNKKKDMKPIHKWLEQKSGKLVYSNQEKVQKELRQLQEYYRAGKALFIPKEKVEKEIIEIKKKHVVKSNDSHMIGLAKASNAKVLCANDKKLCKDFKNIIGGDIYQAGNYKHVLTTDLCP